MFDSLILPLSFLLDLILTLILGGTREGARASKRVKSLGNTPATKSTYS